MEHLELYATCTTGLEWVTAQELSALGAEVTGTGQSRVFFRAQWELVYRLHLFARTVNRFFALLAQAQVGSLQEIEEVAWQVPYEEWFSNRTAFAIRSERDGTHDFTSMDIA
ncbi:MAG: THUMP domain-containing protein, partial [Armatimonadetes bacterium]|nr:THUMP domain-containing protein [Armatimonadota bacterium]